MIKRIVMAVTFAATLAGCSMPRMQDGYQLGDLSGSAVDGTVQVLTLQHRYCTESDPVARAVLLNLIRAAVPGYPAAGLCTDVLDAIGDDDK
jgi:hypothetical protein